jgi:hypothetical protein
MIFLIVAAMAFHLPSDKVVTIDRGPITKDGKNVAAGFVDGVVFVNGKAVVKGRAYTREEMLALGAVPESLRDIEPPALTTNVRTLLNDAVTRKELAFAKEEIAAVPLAVEALKALDAEHAKDPKAAERKADYRQRLALTLKDCFGAKAERLLEIRMGFDGLAAALTDPLRRKEIGISDPQFDQLTKAMAGWQSQQQSKFDNSLLGKADLTPEEVKRSNDLAYKELERRRTLQESEELKLLTAGQREKWAKMIGKPPGFRRPEPWFPTP